jgi:predicted transposase YbfD/YdcC
MVKEKKVYNLSNFNGVSKKRLIEIVSKIPDPRRKFGNIRHLLVDLLVITIFAVVCGCNGWTQIHDYAIDKQEWLKTLLELPNGIPLRSTFKRFLGWMNPVHLEESYREWVKPYVGSLNSKHLCIDGKEIRLAEKMEKTTINMVSAYVCEDDVPIGQIRVDSKSNEITAIPQLLKAFDLTGAIVSIDAIGCQRQFAQIINQGHGYYLFHAKDNQPTLHAEMEEYLTWAQADPIEKKFITRARDSCAWHGRITHWDVVASSNVGWFESIKDWPGLSSAIMVTRTVTKGGETKCHTSVYVSSYQATAKVFCKMIRDHWRIENNLHWVLDIEFNEDKCTIRKGNAPQNLSLIRKMALVLLRNDHSLNVSIQRKQRYALLHNDYLLNLFK